MENIDERAEFTLAIPVTPEDHAQGDPNAPVTLVEYGDYQCPSCGAAYPAIKQVQKDLGSDLRVVFRNFPLRQAHPYAQIAAEAAECAGAQGKFWEMHDLLFQNQFGLEKDDLIQYADQLGLDVNRFTRELEQKKFAKRVSEDFRGGIRSNVNGTPGLFINGVRYDGSFGHTRLLEALRAELERTRHRKAG